MNAYKKDLDRVKRLFEISQIKGTEKAEEDFYNAFSNLCDKYNKTAEEVHEDL